MTANSVEVDLAERVRSLETLLDNTLRLRTGSQPDLRALNDVSATQVTNGQVLVYNKAAGQWLPAAKGATTLAALTDVNAPSPANAQVLTWDALTSKWVPFALPTMDRIAVTRRNAAQTVTHNAAAAKVQFNTTEANVGGMTFNTGTYVVTVPTAGLYMVEASVRFSGVTFGGTAADYPWTLTGTVNAMSGTTTVATDSRPFYVTSSTFGFSFPFTLSAFSVIALTASAPVTAEVTWTASTSTGVTVNGTLQSDASRMHRLTVTRLST